MERRRVVITGVGAASPFGVGVDTYWAGLRGGVSALGNVTLFEGGQQPCNVVGEVKGFNPDKYLKKGDTRRVPRVVPIALCAANEALAAADIDPAKMDIEDKQGVSVVVGTGGGGVDYAEKQYELYFQKESRKVNPYAVSSSFVGMLSSEISINYGFRGSSHVISTGCTSSTDAMGYALNQIRSGISDIVLTGGADACITPGVLAGFCRMKAVATKFNDRPKKASRPFNIDRDGFVLGEGGWILIFEELEHALKRGADIYAEVRGYGSTCDAYHRVMTTPDGAESARAITLAIADADIGYKEVDYINLHGTSTMMNDSTETKAVKLAMNGHHRSVSTSATKSMIGHPQGACGAAGLTATLLAIRHNFIHPTINYDNPDPECNLDYTPNEGIEKEVNNAVCNTIAFGSKNSALAIAKYRGVAS